MVGSKQRRALLLAALTAHGCTPLIGGTPAQDAAHDTRVDEVSDVLADTATDAPADGASDARADVAHDALGDGGCSHSADASGRPDPTLLGHGAAGDFPLASIKGAMLDGRGRIYVFGSRDHCVGEGTNHDAFVGRYDADGHVDATFAGGGGRCVHRDLEGQRAEVFLGMDIDPSGRPVLVGTSGVGEQYTLLVARFTEGGAPDDRFGDGGVAYYDFRGPLARSAVGYAVTAEEGGMVVVGGDSDPYVVSTVGFVVRVLDHGAIDPGFSGGEPWLELATAGFTDVARTPRGYVAVGASRVGFRPLLSLLGRDGRPVTDFGDRGVAIHDLPGGLQARALVLDRDGGYVVSGTRSRSPSGAVDGTLALARFHASGEPDTSFGESGVFEAPAITDAAYFLHPTLAARCDGRLYVGGLDVTQSGRILAVTSRGALDVAFAEGGVRPLFGGHPRALLLDPRDGRLTVVAERVIMDGGVLLQRYLP